MPYWNLQHLAWLIISILQFLEGDFVGAPILERRPDHNNGSYLLYSLQEVCWFFMSPANQHREDVGDRAYGLSSLSKKTRISEHLRMS